jgi:hypothetical protein
VDGLQAYFGGQIEFYHVDTDDSIQVKASRPFGVYRHSQYVLLDGQGNVLHEWNGYLRPDEVSQTIESSLAQQPTTNH